jgi:hypothetical protein
MADETDATTPSYCLMMFVVTMGVTHVSGSLPRPFQAADIGKAVEVK